ncbi:hypothetical protein HDU67_007149 [Dinochytrium kinnereticum]|nr:hypothetical protein HDU67_007149 [Dinochytrium kinnereticum]
MDEDEPIDQDVMRKRLEEFRRRKALDKIKAKADRQRGVDNRNFTVPIPKKEVIPEIVPSIMNDASPVAPVPVSKPTGMAHPKTKPSGATTRSTSAAAPSKTHNQATNGPTGPPPRKQTHSSTTTTNAPSNGSISLKTHQEQPIKPVSYPVPSQPTKAGVLKKSSSRSNLPTSSSMAAANSYTTAGSHGVGVGHKPAGVSKQTQQIKSAINGVKQPKQLAPASGVASNDQYYISADSLQEFMKSGGNTLAQFGGAGSEASITKRTSKSNLQATSRDMSIMTDRFVMLTRGTQTEAEKADDESWSLKVKMVELFEEADRRAESDSDKRIAAQCLRMFVSMLDAVTNSPHVSKTSASKSSSTLSSAKPLSLNEAAGTSSGRRSANRISASTNWEETSPSSPVGGRGSSLLASQKAGLTPVLRPGAYRSTDQAKYTPHDDDDDEDYEEDGIDDEEDEDMGVSAPSSAKSVGSASLNGSGKKSADTDGPYHVTAPGVRPRVGHLDEDSEIPEPPRSKFLEDMEAEEQQKKILSPFVVRTQTFHNGARFEAQFPSGDGDDEEDEEISASLQRVRFEGAASRTPGGMVEEEMEVELNDTDRHSALWQKHRDGPAARRNAGHTPRPPARSTYEDEDDDEEGGGDNHNDDAEDNEEDQEEEDEDEEYDDRFTQFPRSRPLTTHLGSAQRTKGTPHASSRPISLRPRTNMDDPGMQSIVGMLNGMQLGESAVAAASLVLGNGEDGVASSPAGVSASERIGRVAVRKHGQKEVRVGPDEIDGGSCTVLTPRRASRKEREELGVDSVVTSARRSVRLFKSDVLKPSETETTDEPAAFPPSSSSSSMPASGAAPRTEVKVLPYHAGRIGNLDPFEVKKVQELLEESGLAYVPNELLPRETPTPVTRPTGILNRTLPGSLTNTGPHSAPHSATRTILTRPARTTTEEGQAGTPTSSAIAPGLTGSATVGRRANVLTPGGSRVNVLGNQQQPLQTPLTRAKASALRAANFAKEAASLGVFDPEATPRAR